MDAIIKNAYVINNAYAIILSKTYLNFHIIIIKNNDTHNNIQINALNPVLLSISTELRPVNMDFIIKLKPMHINISNIAEPNAHDTAILPFPCFADNIADIQSPNDAPYARIVKPHISGVNPRHFPILLDASTHINVMNAIQNIHIKNEQNIAGVVDESVTDFKCGIV